jgi:hypothetical protein
MAAMTHHARTRSVVLLAALMLGSTGLLGACGDDEPTAEDPSPAGGTTGGSPTSGQSTGATGEPTDEQSPTSAPPTGSADTVAAPVYLVGDTPQGPRLFREFRQVEADNPLEEAAALMTAGDSLDHDYRTLFPGGAFESVTKSEGAGAYVVQLADDTWEAPADGMSRREAKLAVQQLVYTIQGVGQERLPVLVQLGADPAPLFGIDTSRGLQAAPQLDVLALVNVTTPEEGATVSGSFTASGVASSFEATVPWEIRAGDASGEVVKRGFSTAEGWMDKLYPWKTQVDVSDLDPGSYAFVALTDDPSGGEGAGPTEDSKTITVE